MADFFGSPTGYYSEADKGDTYNPGANSPIPGDPNTGYWPLLGLTSTGSGSKAIYVGSFSSTSDSDFFIIDIDGGSNNWNGSLPADAGFLIKITPAISGGEIQLEGRLVDYAYIDDFGPYGGRTVASSATGTVLVFNDDWMYQWSQGFRGTAPYDYALAFQVQSYGYVGGYTIEIYRGSVGDDTDPPNIASSTPGDNATNFPVNSDIVLTFNEEIQKGAGTIQLYKNGGEPVAATITFSFDKVTINPNSTLAANTGYYITIGPNAVLDKAGNAFPAITSSTGFNFTTGPAPTGVDLTVTLHNINTDLGIGGYSTTTTAGGSVIFDYEILNSGATASGAGTIGYYLSTDPTITTGDRLIVTGNLFNAVPGGGSSGRAGSTIKLPTDIGPGTYYLGVIVDKDNAVSETNENNNASVAKQITIAQQHGGHSYAFVSAGEGMSWTEAQEAAAAMGGYLVNITSQAENTFVHQTVLSGRFVNFPDVVYLGGERASQGSAVWRWDDGPEQGQAFGYTNWSSGEPNNNGGSENVLVMYSDGTWNDTVDNYSFAVGYVVEFNAADDFADRISDTASPIGQLAIGTSKAGFIEIADDRDFFKITLASATKYHFVLSGQDGGGGSLNNPHLWLHDSKGKVLAQNGDIISGSNLDAQITFATKKAGIYYLQAAGFDIAETGSYQLTATAIAPEINVSGNGINIADNDLSAETGDGTAFGNVGHGSTVVHSFTVSNTGNDALTISNLKIPKGFALVETLSTSIAPGQSDTFQVRVDTSKIGTKTGSISFKTNDLDETPFNFALSANVIQASSTVHQDGAGNASLPSLIGVAAFEFNLM